MPLNLKLRGDVGKYVMRKAAEPWLPPDVLKGRKYGFQMPFGEWFSGDFSAFAREAWQGSGAADAGYLDVAGVDRIFNEHRSGAVNHGRILFAITMFSCWWKDELAVSGTRLTRDWFSAASQSRSM